MAKTALSVMTKEKMSLSTATAASADNPATRNADFRPTMTSAATLTAINPSASRNALSKRMGSA
jgi:hypothetical protein